MKIGNLDLENNVFLAPMAGVTDLPFRLLCKEMGCGLVYSEMVSAKGILYDNKNTTELLEIDPNERPVAVQLFGSDPEILGAMAKKIEPYPIDIIDVNTEEYPDGIYHPHPDVQHIKKENIGLIEVMGLAILPPRLQKELAEVEKYVLGRDNDIAEYHRAWADEIKRSHPEATEGNVTGIVQDAVGKVFSRVLEDAGVYKRTPEGKAAFMKFVQTLGTKEK